MIARFGNVVFWTCSTIAALIMLGFTIANFDGTFSAPDIKFPMAGLAIGAICSAPFYLFGCAVRYITAEPGF